MKWEKEVISAGFLLEKGNQETCRTEHKIPKRARRKRASRETQSKGGRARASLPTVPDPKAVVSEKSLDLQCWV